MNRQTFTLRCLRRRKNLKLRELFKNLIEEWVRQTKVKVVHYFIEFIKSPHTYVVSLKDGIISILPIRFIISADKCLYNRKLYAITIYHYVHTAAGITRTKIEKRKSSQMMSMEIPNASHGTE
jgi:hypothetical protein